MSDPVREFLSLGKNLLDQDAVVTETDKDAIVDHLASKKVSLLGGGSWSSAFTPVPQRSFDQSDIESEVSRASSDPVSWRVCEIIASGYVEAGEALPEVLRKWCSDFLNGRISKPDTDKISKYKLRDSAIAQAVEIAVETYSVKPTRNDASPPESACDIVARCLEEQKVSASFDSVKKIYSNWKKRKA